MSTTRLADRRIRAAAIEGAPRLDVRGPISEALARTGLDVPPAPPEPAAQEGLEAPAPRAVGAAVRGLEARMPTPIRPPVRLGPVRPSDGLTADEQRVHRVLVDALEALARESKNALGTLSYAERKGVEGLDLAYLEAELAAMHRREADASVWLRRGLALIVVLLPLLAVAGRALDVLPVALAAGAVLATLSARLHSRSGGNAATRRRRIYEALRELSIAADPGASPSAAVAEADRIIDRLAFADSGLEAPSDRAPAARRRVRS